MSFDGRTFLHQFEWETYLRRMPVRYIKKTHEAVCCVCGLPGTKDKPLEHAHVIGFNVGIRKFGLTPEYLDSHQNIRSAHRGLCNRKVEVPEQEVAEALKKAGITSLPDYLKTARS